MNSFIKKLTTKAIKIKKKFKVIKLVHFIKNDHYYFSLQFDQIWKCNSITPYSNFAYEISALKIFGQTVNIEQIDWHKDYISGFRYPLKRLDKISISKWYNKGIDIKFPWEISRFYFAIKLAQFYRFSRKPYYYEQFKTLFLDWIKKNPFCYGVNWYCTMEVAIRAINWIVALNIFGDVFYRDREFNQIILKSLVQHAEYISLFPEIYENGHTTNHTTADYAGLLFLALSLKAHPKVNSWLKQSIQGLEGCIRYQTYADGVNFEASIAYHRLVLELFAYSALVAHANGINFSKTFYALTFKMFEYTAAYIDSNGYAPQVGDNDSGRILIFHDSDEHDHAYLLDLGEHIFNYHFKSQCKKRTRKIINWLPVIDKINVIEK